jgi:hypothetical protein
MASWTSWTDLIDIPLGTTLYTSSWNVIFGPNGNEAHLKKYADALTYEQETIYNLEELVIHGGWPQGSLPINPYFLPDDVYYVTGDVTYPNWTTLGVRIGNNIELAGPAKYLAVINIDTLISYISFDINYPPLLRIIVSDTSGNLHLQKTIYSQLRNPVEFPDYSNSSFSFPFLIDTNTKTNLVVGFTLQGGEPFISSPFVKLKNSSSIIFHKLPAFIPTLEASTSFILGTTTLSGTSEF